MDAPRAAALLPQYRSHKQVWAAPIESVDAEGIMILRCSPTLTTAVKPANAMFARYTPVPGDYYVVYGDGYAAISPKAAFEEGYKLVEAH